MKRQVIAILIIIIAMFLIIGNSCAATCTQNIDGKTHSKVIGSDKLQINKNTIKLSQCTTNKHGFNYHIDNITCYYKNGDVKTYSIDCKKWKITLNKNVKKVVIHYTKMNTKELKIVTDAKLIPKKISITAKPSCGCNYKYKWYEKTFYNYCPNCHCMNCLSKNPKGVHEKELTCKKCDSDFCGVCGKEKYSWSSKRLIK